jgi:hypothetical protein
VREEIDLSAYVGTQVLFRFFSRTDGSVPGDGFYFDDFRVLDYVDDGGTTFASTGSGSPMSFKLHQNYPNPFNPASEIRFEIPVGTHATVKIFDVLGKDVTTLVDGYLPAGMHTVRWDAKDTPSGVYFYRLSTREFVQTRKLMVLR